MKLYIPTCTLNLNNILSTESISPYIFYTERTFGNKRFEKVVANNFENCLLLYSKIPLFAVQDTEIDNFWMVIEVNTDTFNFDDRFQKYSPVEGVDIYSSRSTIYLNPFTTKFYIKDRLIFSLISSKAEQSLENKFFSLYHRADCFWPLKKDAETETFLWNKSFTTQITDTKDINYYKEEINNDKLLDRVKGFAYCYLIGANSSSSQEISELKFLTKKMSNTLSAVANSPDRKPTSSEDEALLSNILRFDVLFQGIDERWLYNNKIIDQRLEQTIFKRTCALSREQILDGFDKLGLKKYFLESCSLEYAFDAYNEVYAHIKKENFFENYQEIIKKLSNAVGNLTYHEHKKQKYHPNELFTISSKYVDEIKDNKFKTIFYCEILNSLIRDDYKNESSQTRKNSLIVLSCGKLLKKIVCGIDENADTKWKNLPIRSYINGLLDNLEQYTKFNIFDIEGSDYEELKYFAAFVQKSSDDIDKLADYLLQCGFPDYRLSYGLYGATEGFATLPKTFTATFLNHNDLNYVYEIYKEIYYDCFSISLDHYLLDKNDVKTIDVNMQIEYKNDTPFEQESNAHIDNLFYILKDNIKNFPINKLAESYYKEQISPIYKGNFDQSFYDSLECIKPFNGKDNFKKVKSFIKKQIIKQPTQIQSQHQISLYDQSSQTNTPTINFYNDPNATTYISNILDTLNIDQRIKESILKNLSYLQKEYSAPNGYYYKDEKNHPRDNKKVITHFGHLQFKAKGDRKIVDTSENREIINSIVKKLNEKYNVRK